MGVENQEVQGGEDTTGQDVSRETEITQETSTEEGGEEESGGTGTETAQPDWAPTYKFKVHEEEKEFDDFLKPLVKSKEDEEKIRDILERAYGLDHVKADRATLREHNRALASEVQEFGNVKKELQALGGYLKNRDFESFKEAFNIPDELIMQYALQKVKLANASPEEQAAYQAQRAEAQRLRALEDQNRAWQESYQNYVVSTKETELNFVLSQPDVVNVMQEFDSRLGQPGAFRNEIVRRGQMHFNATGQDLSAKQVVDTFISMLGVVPGQASSPQTVQPGQVVQNRSTGQKVVTGAQAAKPVVPHIPGSGASPVRKVPKSISELRKLGQTM